MKDELIPLHDILTEIFSRSQQFQKIASGNLCLLQNIAHVARRQIAGMHRDRCAPGRIVFVHQIVMASFDAPRSKPVRASAASICRGVICGNRLILA
jgi:hypothetical protein